MYLRVDSGLRIPVVAFQHSRCRRPIHTREAHELADRTLLLGRVGWRHLVLVTVSSSVQQARDKVELRGDSGVDGAKLSLTRGNTRGEMM
jgi:hypothetical protein